MITSKTNSIIKKTASLKLKKNRDQTGTFIIEGDKFIRDAINQGFKYEYILVGENMAQRYKDVKDKFTVSDDIVKLISGTKTPQGVVGVFYKPVYKTEEILRCERVLFLEGVQSGENAGALIRSAVCAGFDAVVANENTADLFSEKAVRSSAASILNILSFRTDDAILDALKHDGFEIIGSSVSGEEDFRKPEGKFVLIISNEGGGISPEVAGKCARLVRIPVYGKCDSLNAAVAGGILMYKSIGY